MNALKPAAIPDQYDASAMRQWMRDWVTWSQQFTAPLVMAVRIVDAKELPTVSDLAAIPSGSVYNDAGVLKVKP